MIDGMIIAENLISNQQQQQQKIQTTHETFG